MKKKKKPKIDIEKNFIGNPTFPVLAFLLLGFHAKMQLEYETINEFMLLAIHGHAREMDRAHNKQAASNKHKTIPHSE